MAVVAVLTSWLLVSCIPGPAGGQAVAPATVPAAAVGMPGVQPVAWPAAIAPRSIPGRPLPAFPILASFVLPDTEEDEGDCSEGPGLPLPVVTGQLAWSDPGLFGTLRPQARSAPVSRLLPILRL